MCRLVTRNTNGFYFYFYSTFTGCSMCVQCPCCNVVRRGPARRSTILYSGLRLEFRSTIGLDWLNSSNFTRDYSQISNRGCSVVQYKGAEIVFRPTAKLSDTHHCLQQQGLGGELRIWPPLLISEPQTCILYLILVWKDLLLLFSNLVKFREFTKDWFMTEICRKLSDY